MVSQNKRRKMNVGFWVVFIVASFIMSHIIDMFETYYNKRYEDDRLD